MTAAEMAEAARRLREMERLELLPAETIAELKRWWWTKLRTDRLPGHPNVIMFPQGGVVNGGN